MRRIACIALNKRAAEIARAVADKAGRKVIVAGSVGPTGELLVPLGAMTYDEAVDAFAEQIEGLKAGGAEVAWIETMSAPDEIRAAAEAAIRVGLPYTYTGSFDTAGRTMMGLLPKDIHGVADGLSRGPLGVGANCGVGASDILASLLDMTEAKPEATVIVKGNCGIPEFRGTEIHYSGTPELMADYVRLAVDAGAKIIGGCCGTSFQHLAAMRKALDAHTKAGSPDGRRRSSSASARCATRWRRKTPPRPAKPAASAVAAGPDAIRFAYSLVFGVCATAPCGNPRRQLLVAAHRHQLHPMMRGSVICSSMTRKRSLFSADIAVWQGRVDIVPDAPGFR